MIQVLCRNTGCTGLCLRSQYNKKETIKVKFWRPLTRQWYTMSISNKTNKVVFHDSRRHNVWSKKWLLLRQPLYLSWWMGLLAWSHVSARRNWTASTWYIVDNISAYMRDIHKMINNWIDHIALWWETNHWSEARSMCTGVITEENVKGTCNWCIAARQWKDSQVGKV